MSPKTPIIIRAATITRRNPTIWTNYWHRHLRQHKCQEPPPRADLQAQHLLTTTSTHHLLRGCSSTGCIMGSRRPRTARYLPELT